ncbi:unnamed protein product [Adineta steineri]|uniref:Uncharacterized protein n=1 Tax=Adineta steineri TaxID=433720 RepID=A0A819I4K9_9BILA|nr:unnamed protein product [Adineta steineri]CAF3910848.1 unnamed protein product [Adineta steineri]
METIKKQLDNFLHHVSLRSNNNCLCKIKDEKNTKFIDILSCSCIDDGIEYLSNNNFQETIDIADACLKFDDQYFASLFINAKHRIVFMIITKLALHLLSNLNDLKLLEYGHFYNIGLLTIKIMHNKYIDDAEKEEFYDIFFRYRFQSNNLTECLLQFIQNITDSSLFQTICLWLDIVVHYQHAIRKQRNDLDYTYFEPRKIISECIIKQIYNLPNDLRLRGSFLFYSTYIPYDHINEDEKLAWICRKYVVSQMKDLNEWTSDTTHCVMGSVCFITKHFSQHFKYDEQYYESLLIIVSYENFHKALVSTSTNDETILIHTIIEYFYENLDHDDEKMIITLGTAIDNLQKLYKKIKDDLIKMNICYLILVSTHEKSHASDEIILKCFEYIKNQRHMTWNGDIKLRKADKFLRTLKKASHYDSIKDAIIRLDKINELVDLIESDSDIICAILALLSTKPDAQRILLMNDKNGSTALHIASYNGHNEIVQLLLKAGASRTIRNRPYDLTAYEEARTQSTKDLFRMNLDDNEQERFSSDDVYIEWMTTSRNPHKKRNYLREKLNQLQTYSNYEIDQVYKVLAEHMYAYIDTLTLSNRIKQISKQYFTEMKETHDPVYIIKVYTSTTSFHKYYNAYIAKHGIDFFDPFSVDIHADYAIIKSLMKTIAIVMYDQNFSKYRYCGKTYRGMLLTEEDLYKYVVHSKIMNKSFLSTSKSKETAEVFGDCKEENCLRKTPDKQAIETSVLCTYVIKNDETALNIETISELISDEEVLILPFSIFEVKSVQRSSTNIVQIELEEASDELLDNYY